MQCAHWYDQQRLFLAMLHLLQQQSNTVMFNIIVFKHFVFSWSVIALELQRSSSSPTPFLLHLWEAVSFTFWVRIQMSTFVQSEVPDNIFVVSILNSENQLVTIDLQFQKNLFALVCEDKMSNIKIHTVAFTCHLLGPINPGLDIGRSPSTRIPDLSFPVRSSSTKTYFPINVFGELNH